MIKHLFIHFPVSMWVLTFLVVGHFSLMVLQAIIWVEPGMLAIVLLIGLGFMLYLYSEVDKKT